MSIQFFDHLKTITNINQRRFEIRKAFNYYLNLNDFSTAEQVADLMDDLNSKDSLIYDICTKLLSFNCNAAFILSSTIRDETDKDICLSQIAIKSYKTKDFTIFNAALKYIKSTKVALHTINCLYKMEIKAKNKTLAAQLLLISSYYDFEESSGMPST